ncbi:MAG: ATP-dependent Clp protease ATP-binding subunit ClpC [Candidatus Magasanikbacteria bacterium CG10_big_fil_rev_8_21_14_0_10_36_32]|uniref:ATP-dependent Clp protease ATP-binding subunit ClpC n=1 Tax=Candidatus Magasanikbacteria bacterium CG10_big_fil_rev_8_21_14_0_10_36_32 TaxID=1974646 RepID=A0A2M6W6J8_9BACT|nr:MAG: ATP-dependent Clp protease ATP-binding subunit ClpC [Candidatus Magasanikbacteria bacterium CG10_big_fil_rev_8_21_14_0_10_36_32]
MDILERFSSHLREVLARGLQLATELKNPEVEPLHLFFCLSNEKGSVATEILNRFKIDPKIIEQTIFSLPTISDNDSKTTKNSAEQYQIIPFSNRSKLALEKAIFIAQQNQHNYLGTEHLLEALLELEDSQLKEIFKVSNIKEIELKKQINTTLLNSSQFPQINEVAEVTEKIQENLLGLEPEILPGAKFKKQNKTKESALEYFSINLTDIKNQKNIDPVVGRQAEIERLTQIICRRTKNNPILLGDPGVGKTAIVEGLAKNITTGNVPDMLRQKKIYAVDMGLLIAGTIYRGEFESRLKQIIDEASADPDIILFIDEVHNIVGAGSNQGTMDAANILKPALARGHIRCIGSTTPAEFKKFIESDAALERRFQPIYVREPSLEETIKILHGIKKNYEEHHQVKISDDAITAAVDLSSRHITGKFLPDKAIDLMDETAAAKRLNAEFPIVEKKLILLKERLRYASAAKEKAALNNRFGEAINLKDEEHKLSAEIKKIEKLLSEQKIKFFGTVTDKDMLNQVAKMTGSEPSELILNNKKRYTQLANELKQHIIGQDHVINDIIRLIQQAQLGISHPEKPLASFLFVGSSGTGKTELAKKLASALYPGQDALIKLDMTEFSESFGVSKLLGSPAGYVGYKETNRFTDRIKINPFSIIIFDEIDKAHAEVTKLLLQILDGGEITDSVGKKISLKHAIIILTSSFGSEDLQKGLLGFGDGTKDDSETKKCLIEKLKNRFTPELINRLDEICLFNELSEEHLSKIAELELQQLNNRLKKYNTAINAESEVLNKMIKQLPDKNNNARNIRQKIRTEIENMAANIIIKGKIKPQYQLKIKNNNLSLNNYLH